MQSGDCPSATRGVRIGAVGELVEMIGRTLSHYRVLAEIGQGGMGVVYRAIDVRLSREVAIKVLPPELVGDPERKRRFFTEARAAAAISHPHIAVVHEIGEDHGVSFIAMELIEGEKLSELIARELLSIDRALEIGIDITSGVSRAHEKGIVHRDLKPANVMLTADGDAKIIDFGLAKPGEPLRPLESNLETITRGGTTHPGAVMGTFSYMSPEQARGQTVDSRSDIFALGIILYEMLTGELPFEGESGADRLGALLKDPPRMLPALELSESVQNELQRILDRCLAKSPADRYDTAAELLAQLRAVRDIRSTRPRGAAKRQVPLITGGVALIGRAPSSLEHIPL
jgi:serine/threonine protein kinase